MRKTLLCFVVLIAATLRGDILLPIFFQNNGSSTTPFTIRNQQTWDFCCGTATNTSMPALPHPLTNGSILLLGTQNFTILGTGVTITDTAGLTWNSLSKNQWTNGTSDFFCATNTTTQAADVINFSTAPSTNTQFTTMDVIELTSTNGGLTCATKIDQQGGGTNSSSGAATEVAVSPGLISTVANDFVWVNAFTNGVGTLTPDTSFTGNLPVFAKAAGASNGTNDITQYVLVPTIRTFQAFIQNSVTAYGYSGYTVAVKP